MDLKSSLLVAVVYLAAGALVMGAVYMATSKTPTEQVPADRRLDPSAGADSRGQNAADSGESVTRRRALSAQHAQQIRRLRQLLHQKAELAQSKASLLEKKTKAHASLKKELDDLIAVLLEMMPQLPANQNGAGPADLARVRQELSRTRAMESTLADELTELQNELSKTKEEIETLQRAAELEVAALVEDHKAFQQAASKAAVGGGAASVPALIELLSNSRPDVRQWAAEVLGNIGAGAKDAAPALLEAVADRDPRVRQAAAAALRAVESQENSEANAPGAGVRLLIEADRN